MRAGVFTAVQRFRSDLGLYVHLRCLVTDGAFEQAVLATVKIRRIPPTNFAAESTHAKGRQRASRWRPSSLCAA
jgi:hypothetical protein